MKLFNKKQRDRHMPLWLQAVIETLQNAVIMYLCIALPIIVGTAISNMSSWADIGGFTVGAPLRISGSAWLLTHGVSVALANFKYTLIPLALIALPVWMNYRSGKKLMAAASKGKIMIAWFAGTVAYMLFTIVMYLLSSQSFAPANDIQAIGIPTFLCLLSLVAGSVTASGRWENLFGLSTEQEVSVTRRYLRTVAGSAGVMLTAAIFVSGLFLCLSAVFNWAQATVIYEAASLGFAGVWGMFFAQLVYLPNFIMWTFSWIANIGFSIGEGTHFSPTDHTAKTLPLVPLTAAIPGPVGLFWLFFLIVALACAVLAGWWFWRNIPLEIDKELGHQIDNPLLRNTISAIASALSVALLGGGLLTLLAWLSSGSIGSGNLSFVGINALNFFWKIVLIILAGVLCGHLGAPWLEDFKNKIVARKKGIPTKTGTPTEDDVSKKKMPFFKRKNRADKVEKTIEKTLDKKKDKPKKKVVQADATTIKTDVVKNVTPTRPNFAPPKPAVQPKVEASTQVIEKEAE